MSRLWIGKKYKTREALEAAISRFERRAEKHERTRDAAEYESAAYWLAHDRFVYWSERARELMPRGS